MPTIFGDPRRTYNSFRRFEHGLNGVPQPEWEELSERQQRVFVEGVATSQRGEGK